MLRKIANASTDPRHIKTGKADGECGHNVETPIPAMKDGEAVPDLRNKLKHPGQDDDDGRDQMHGNGEVAHGIARDVAMREVLTPRLLRGSSQSRHPVERCHFKGK